MELYRIHSFIIFSQRYLFYIYKALNFFQIFHKIYLVPVISKLLCLLAGLRNVELFMFSTCRFRIRVYGGVIWYFLFISDFILSRMNNFRPSDVQIVKLLSNSMCMYVIGRTSEIVEKILDCLISDWVLS